MQVSVITPAYNAAETIEQTIKSVQAQTHNGWELIIVDDGSTDNTIQIVQELCKNDNRIKLIYGEHRGASAARNIGIQNAGYEWILFLDSDDIILPDHMELLTGKLSGDPDLDIAYANWARLSPSGEQLDEEPFDKTGDLFEIFARTCAFSIHSCISRRLLIIEAGGFDESFITCEDWDLWQRMARIGAKFGTVQKILALYRMRPDSASINSVQMLKDNLKVLEIGHSPDPRIKNPLSVHANGCSRNELQFKIYHCSIWPAGLALGNGKNIEELLSIVPDNPCPDLDPTGIAETLFKAALLPGCKMPDDWIALYPAVEKKLDLLLDILENKSGTIGLKKRTKRVLEKIILENAGFQHSAQVGTSCAMNINTNLEIKDFPVANGVHNFYARINYDDHFIGYIHLPVIGNCITAELIKDRISESFTWEILERYLSDTIYNELEISNLNNKYSFKRNGVNLAEISSENGMPDWTEIHNEIGWTVFLQELWNLPYFASDDFYRSNSGYASEKQITVEHLTLLEVGLDVPDLDVKCSKIEVVVSAGGSIIGKILLANKDHISSAELMAEINSQCGYELCRVAVKNSLIGYQPDNLNIHDRLALLYDQRKPQIINNGYETKILPVINIPVNELVLGRRLPELMGRSTSRKYILPGSCSEELIRSSGFNSEPIISNGMLNPVRIIYDPEMIEIKELEIAGNGDINKYNYSENFFEELFLHEDDPWKYNNEYEQNKYNQTLSLIPEHGINDALEIGCAEGIFTGQLAPLVNKLTASDISQTALNRAKERCKSNNNINYLQLDIYKDSIKDKYDLIVCSEVLYYLPKEKLKIIAAKIAAALKPGGLLVMAHANVIVDEPEQTGFDWDVAFGSKTIGSIFSSVGSLSLVKEIKTPLYRVHKFRKKSIFKILPAKKEVVLQSLDFDLPDFVSSQIIWKNSDDKKTPEAGSSTERLPILMYHRVAPEGNDKLTRYRVTPEIFEQQIKYLHDNGYHSATLQEWGDAIYYKQPLKGKAIMLTFDDGYCDFYRFAFPVLRKYNFSAVVFLVTNNVGKTNSWDNNYGEEVPLMGWKEIKKLHGKGIEFGSHTHNHFPLTALSHEEIVKEASISREVLTRELGVNTYSFCYPYGDRDEIVDHLIGGCGYIYGLSCEPGLSDFNNSHLCLPRIEITGTDSIEDFIDKVNNYGY